MDADTPGRGLQEGSTAPGSSADTSVESMVEEFDVALAAEHLDKMNTRRRFLLIGQLAFLTVLVIIALVAKKATFSPWYTPLAIPIYIVVVFMLAVAFEDFYFDNERIKDTDPRLRHRLVDRYIKRLYLPIGVLAVIMLLLITPFLINIINDNTTEEDSLSISEKGPGRYTFHGRDPFDLTVFHYIQIKSDPPNLKINCTIQYEEVANEIAENRSIPNAEAREPYYDATRLNTNKNLNTPSDPKDGRMTNNSFYEVRFPPDFWEFRSYAITIYNPNKARVDVYFKFGKELDTVFVNILRIVAIIALAGHILWLIYLQRKKKELTDMYDDYVAMLEQRKKEAAEKQSQLEAMRRAPVPPVVVAGGLPMAPGAGAVPGAPQSMLYAQPSMPYAQPYPPQPQTLQGGAGPVAPGMGGPVMAIPQSTPIMSTTANAAAAMPVSPGVLSAQPPQQPAPLSGPPAPYPASASPASPPAVAATKIRCPQCKTTFDVPVEPRPLSIRCPQCGKTGTLTAKGSRQTSSSASSPAATSPSAVPLSAASSSPPSSSPPSPSSTPSSAPSTAPLSTPLSTALGTPGQTLPQVQPTVQPPNPAASAIAVASGGSGEKTKIKCPGCKNIFEVPKVRPLAVECPFCHRKGTLK